MNTADYLLANGRADDVAIIDGYHGVTFAALRHMVGRLASELVSLDLPAGAPVAVLGPNSAFWVAAYLAVLATGYVAVPLSTKLTPETIARQMAWTGSVAALVDRRSLREATAAFDPGLPVLTDQLLGTDGPVLTDTAEVSLDDDAALMFTSGTTAQPKAVRVTHRNIQANTDSITDYLHLADDDRMLVILPFHYCFGASLLHTHLRVGGSVVLCNSFAFPEAALDQLVREGCTGFAGVPSSYQMLLRLSSLATRELPSLRHLQQAGGKLAPAILTELRAAQPHADLYVMYGQTEATARLSYLPPHLVAEKAGSIGRGIPGVELKVVDELGRPVGPGVTGEIVASGDNISPGYWHDDQASAEKFRDGTLRTGDLAVVDEDGFLYVVDRLDDFIKTWGHRVSSQEIEAVVLELTDLVSAAAVGVPDDEAGEAVVLMAALRPGATISPEEVLAHARARLAKHMVPTNVSLVAELPLTSNGKVNKAAVRSMCAASTLAVAGGA